MDDFSVFYYLSTFYFSLIEFNCTFFSISDIVITYVYYYCINICLLSTAPKAVDGL